jgi:hypothetical protein
VILFLIIKLKHKKPILILPAFYPAVLAALVLISVANRPENAKFEIISLTGSEMISVTQGTDTAVVDISEGYFSPLRTVYALANDAGITEIDTLMLTHYHTKHLSSISRFMSELQVQRLLLPRPQNEDDAWVMAQLAETANALGVVPEMIPENGNFELIKGVTVDYSGINRIERSNSPILCISFSDGEDRLTYLSESSWDADGEIRSCLASFTADSDYILIGEQGPVSKTVFDIRIKNAKCVYLLGDLNAEYFINPESSLYDIISDADIEIGVCRKSIIFGE